MAQCASRGETVGREAGGARIEMLTSEGVFAVIVHSAEWTNQLRRV